MTPALREALDRLAAASGHASVAEVLARRNHIVDASKMVAPPLPYWLRDG